MAACRTVPEGVVLAVRLTPKGGRDGLDGLVRLADGAEVLRVRVRAVPENGAANEALRRMLAKEFGVAAAAVTLLAGATSRIKQLGIAGDSSALAARFHELAGDAP